MPAESAPAAFKEWFNAERYRALAEQLRALEPRFDHAGFLKLTLDGLAGRSLMQRMNQAAIAVDAALPGTYREKLTVLRALAPRIEHGFVTIFLPDFVARFGLDDFDASLDALRFFTRFGSSEFGIRPFIERDPARALAVMLSWARTGDEHERRLASEGCRPRLPWGRRLPALVRDPAPLRPVLETLRDDPALYVRKSVANNLNDIAKDHPDWTLDVISSWDLDQPHAAWIAKRAARTLIKRGHPRALRLFGIGAAPKVDATLTITPRRIKLGDAITLAMSLTSTNGRTQKLAVDYLVHYVKARGSTSAKVFKWTELDVGPRATVALTKRQTIRDFTTRRHHAGRHRVELQVNGRILAEAVFELRR
jgi:3-methyladenine DNA glycosylase AlkC